MLIKEPVENEATLCSFNGLAQYAPDPLKAKLHQTYDFKMLAAGVRARGFWPYLIREFALSQITTVVLVDQTSASTFGVMVDLTTTGVPQKGKLSGGRIGAPSSNWVANTLPRS
ncbi:hypothetical protein [Bradyrhizobium sp. RT10b]|uniref:hypothetical protein n=2 Tax=Bradyrhizobium TaxID=374 RepID=UPI003399B415